VKIGLVSDTHVPTSIQALPREVLDGLQGVDLILHAGDLVSLLVLEPLKAIAETVAVRGNMDMPEVRFELPETRLLTLDGRKIGLIHGHQQRPLLGAYPRSASGYDSTAMDRVYDYFVGEFPRADVVVFGHFHLPVIKTWKGCLLVNPGVVAANPGRRTFAIMTLGKEGPKVEIIPF
jgi:putative phosphoesterase